MPSWLIFLFAIEGGLLSGGVQQGDEIFEHPEYASYVTMEAEMRAGPVFVGSSIETQQRAVDHGAAYPEFAPYRALYTFNAGLRFSVFEIGWEHMCDHPVESNGHESSPFAGGHDRLYARVEVTTGASD